MIQATGSVLVFPRTLLTKQVLAIRRECSVFALSRTALRKFLFYRVRTRSAPVFPATTSDHKKGKRSGDCKRERRFVATQERAPQEGNVHVSSCFQGTQRRSDHVSINLHRNEAPHLICRSFVVSNIAKVFLAQDARGLTFHNWRGYRSEWYTSISRLNIIPLGW